MSRVESSIVGRRLAKLRPAVHRRILGQGKTFVTVASVHVQLYHLLSAELRRLNLVLVLQDLLCQALAAFRHVTT